MNAIAATRPDLAKFLEIKKAAEKRFAAPVQPSAPSAQKSSSVSGSLAAPFAEILKAFRSSGAQATTATSKEPLVSTVEPKIATRRMATAAELADVARNEMQRRKTGLLSAYDKGLTQGQNETEKQVSKNKVGILFDAVA